MFKHSQGKHSCQQKKTIKVQKSNKISLVKKKQTFKKKKTTFKTERMRPFDSSIKPSYTSLGPPLFTKISLIEKKPALDILAVPDPLLNKTNTLLERIQNEWSKEEINFSPLSGEVLIQNTKLPDSNITKLLLYHIRKKGKKPLYYDVIKPYIQTQWNHYK